MPAAETLLRVPKRVRTTVRGIAHEIAGAKRLAADKSSFLRFSRDVFGYRVARFIDPGERPLRVVAFKEAELEYRLNRGDIRAIAETWFVGTYELGVEIRARNIIDLGANIGATSVWLARRYGCEHLVALEPAPENASLVRSNLERNAIGHEVIEAALAREEGTAKFEVTDNSTLGKLGDTGIEVKLVTPQSLVDRFGPQEMIDLVKMDVEGAEFDVLEGDLSWLARVRCLVVEFHDDVRAKRVIARLEDAGFTHADITNDHGYLGIHDTMSVFVRALATVETPRNGAAGRQAH